MQAPTGQQPPGLYLPLVQVLPAFRQPVQQRWLSGAIWHLLHLRGALHSPVCWKQQQAGLCLRVIQAPTPLDWPVQLGRAALLQVLRRKWLAAALLRWDRLQVALLPRWRLSPVAQLQQLCWDWLQAALLPRWALSPAAQLWHLR